MNLITKSNYLAYTGSSDELLINQLKEDLRNKIVSIRENVQMTHSPQPEILLQRTRSFLRHSVKQIQLNQHPFFKNNGQCRGACEWFIALFVNFKKKYPDVSSHHLLIEISKEFKEGVGIQGASLQKNYAENNHHEKVIQALKFDFEEQSELKSSEILKTLSELGDGVYLLSFSGYEKEEDKEHIPGHATAIIVENANYYFFDPNIGLIGTGRDIGSENKINDVDFFLELCKQYSPFGRADELFKSKLTDLSETLGEEEAKIIQEIALDLRAERTCLSAFEVYSIFKEFKDRGRIFSKEEKDTILQSLCILPGLLQVKLELTEAIRLKKCVVF